MHKRAELFSYYELPQNFDWSPADILSFTDNTKIVEVFEFVKAPPDVGNEEEIVVNTSGSSGSQNLFSQSESP